MKNINTDEIDKINISSNHFKPDNSGTNSVNKEKDSDFEDTSLVLTEISDGLPDTLQIGDFIPFIEIIGSKKKTYT